jgi:dihydrodipicolinate synthase/N-acetylneuraminate lyase
MAQAELTGILVARVTSFTADGSEIDAAALKRHVNRLVAAGVHDLVPGGRGQHRRVHSTDPDERKQSHRAVRDGKWSRFTCGQRPLTYRPQH